MRASTGIEGEVGLGLSGQSGACPLRGGFRSRERVSPSLKPKLGRKKTHKTLDTHTTKTKRVLSQGLQDSPLPPCPSVGGWVGTKEEGGWEASPWACLDGAAAGYKACLSLQSLLRRRAADSSHGAVPKHLPGDTASVAAVTLS